MEEAYKFAYSPRGIFIDIDNNIYVSYVGHHLGTGQVWSSHRGINLLYGGFNLRGTSSLFVTSNGVIYVDNGVNGRIEKWALDGHKTMISLPNTQSCHGLFVDTNDILYCSVKDGHRVITLSIERNETWRTAVGTGMPGSAANSLNKPIGIFVDINFDLYVADCENNRIQLFTSGQQNGVSVINDTTKIDNHRLLCPSDVVLDAYCNLYIVDRGNHRVVFVASNFSQYRCLIGCSRNNGQLSDQLSFPTSIGFDSSGNMYITDTGNERVQKFFLQTKLYSKSSLECKTNVSYHFGIILTS